MSKVSVIIPTYNHAEFISETLNSVLQQTYCNWECVIIDDGSTDETHSICQDFINLDDRFKYFLKTNTGVSDTRNFGIQKAEGIYILPLDSDDLIHPNYLEQCVAVFCKHPNLRLVYSNAQLIGESKKKWKLEDYNYRDLLAKNMIFNAAMFKKTDFLETVGYSCKFKDGYEDWDFWIRFLNVHSEVYRIPKILFSYRIKKESRNSEAIANNHADLIKLIYQENKSIYDHFYPERIQLIQDNYSLKKKIESIERSKTYRFLRLMSRLK
jgi:glycosyltransferase involved in cell wall biosynthesis